MMIINREILDRKSRFQFFIFSKQWIRTVDLSVHNRDLNFKQRWRADLVVKLLIEKKFVSAIATLHRWTHTRVVGREANFCCCFVLNQLWLIVYICFETTQNIHS